ncbi:MAG: lipid-A-disaccharide synthase [Gemmatimonadetes bacterium]|nr:lipid-A-disaccharide synthase [Gemmatimonadota bacterium]
MATARRLYVSAGEPSGDAHAAALVRALKDVAPHVDTDAMGGPGLRAAGARIVEPSDRLGAMGLFEAATALPQHLAALYRVQRRLSSNAYDAAVLIDYPGFHLRVARAARTRDVPVLYYIAPQLWAWGAWRARALRETVRLVASVLPFEAPLLNGLGIPATFVGHPVVDASRPRRDEARDQLGIGEGRPVLALLPGSRPGEISRHWPIFRTAARTLAARHPGLVSVLAAAPGARYRLDDAPLLSASAPVALAAADAALCKSGTATLEAAVAGTPMVIAYALNPATFALARRLVQAPFIGLPNLIAGRRVTEELVQSDATPARLAAALEPLLDRSGPTARRQRDDLASVTTRLGPPGVATRVAALAAELAA